MVPDGNFETKYLGGGQRKKGKETPKLEGKEKRQKQRGLGRIPQIQDRLDLGRIAKLEGRKEASLAGPEDNFRKKAPESPPVRTRAPRRWSVALVKGKTHTTIIALSRARGGWQRRRRRGGTLLARPLAPFGFSLSFAKGELGR